MSSAGRVLWYWHYSCITFGYIILYEDKESESEAQGNKS